MAEGVTIGERFQLGRPIGTGGMGVVYLARDLEDGGQVAVKVLKSDDPTHLRWFLREARLLANLSHPGIVRYITQGTMPGSDNPYLVMEWLRGEDLAARLKRGSLTAEETAVVGLQAAQALGHAHRRGVVHRDIKPGNLFLVDKQLERLKILDFGIARRDERSIVATNVGLVVGSPGYMAPEQARGDEDLDARADVFSLGCVLYACLMQKPPFVGNHLMAVLAKILFQEPPSLRKKAGPELDQLVQRMLAKERSDRPPDAVAVAEALAALAGAPAAVAPEPGGPAVVTLAASGEQRYQCVVLARGRPDDLPHLVGEGHPAAGREELAELRQLGEALGARVERLADGALLAVFASTGYTTDLASQAARFALAARGLLPEVPMVVATGRGQVEGALPIGELIDGAVAMLRGVRPGPEIWVDPVTRRLIELRFEVREQPGGNVLVGELDALGSSARQVLGRRTSCVGRERELGALEGIFADCVSEPSPRVALVTGPAGAGKSRLRQELLQRLASSRSAPEIWIGRGDPIRAGSPFGMLHDALRGPLGLVVGEPVEASRAKLTARVATHVRPDDRRRVAELLGELCGAPFPDDDRGQLSAARGDPLALGDLMRRAFEDWVAAETAARPVVLVLEDLHWGDAPTIRAVDAALRDLADRPLFVLALARPEVHDLFEDLFADRQLEEIRLRELSRKACEHLVRQVLPKLDDAVVRQLIERCDGNPFFLEELIRAVGESGGKADALPDTVVAMVQSRFARLPPGARHVLRAASIFGKEFWGAGVGALVGAEREALSCTLGELVQAELISPRREARLQGQEAYTFQHALGRDAAYAALSDPDRVVGHALAARWLEGAGETDAVVLGEHAARGRDPGRAITWFGRAAEQALEGHDFAAAIRYAVRAVELGATGADLGRLRLVETEAQRIALLPGEVVFRQGEFGDRYYVVVEGQLDVSVDGVAVRSLAAGDGFGELALLRQIPRTATVTARSAARLVAVSRRSFLEAVTGHAKEDLLEVPTLPVARPFDAGPFRPGAASTEAQAESLRAVPLLSGLAPAAARWLAQQAEVIEVKTGAQVVEQDADADAYFIIAEGEVRFFVDGVWTGSLGPGQGFGELSVLRGTRRTASGVACSATTLLRIPAPALRTALSPGAAEEDQR